VSFLGEDLDWVITFRGEGYHLGVRSSDKTSGGDLLEFYGATLFWGDNIERQHCNDKDSEKE